LWWNANWHKRFFAELDSQGLVIREGYPVEYTIDVSNANLTGVDLNSFRVIYKGNVLITEFNKTTKKIMFVMPEGFDAVKPKERVTVYYDLIVNGLKSAPRYDPSWVVKYKDFYDFHRDDITEVNGSYYYNSSIYYENGTYYYQGEMVWQAANGTWFYFNGTGIEKSYYYSAQNVSQTAFLGAMYSGLMLDTIQTSNASDTSYAIGNVKALATAWGAYRNHLGEWVKETLTTTMYRNSPTVKYAVSSNISTTEQAWASTLLNLNGSIHFNQTFLDRWNITEYVLNETQTNDTEYQSAVNNASRFSLITETNTINVDSIDWTGADVLGNATIDTYDIGIKQSMSFVYSTGTTDYPLAFNNVMSIQRVTGNVSGNISSYSLVQGTPDNISIASASNGELITVSYKIKRYSGSDELRVMPFMVHSSYLGIHDNRTNRGAALVFLDSIAFDDILIEIWKETRGSNVIYLANISVNFNEWWYDWDHITPLHDDIQGAFEWFVSYLDDVSVSNITGAIGDVTDYMKGLRSIHVNVKSFDNSLMLKIIIHSPKDGEELNGKPIKLIINITVEGETLNRMYYHFNFATTRIQFDRTASILIGYDGNPLQAHLASTAVFDAAVIDAPIGKQTIFIEAEDTNGSVIVESAHIILWENSYGFFLGVTGLIGFIAGASIVLILTSPNIKGKLQKFKSRRGWVSFKV
jgi:hypothetical protein